jgi:phosphoglucosamine mutase
MGGDLSTVDGIRVSLPEGWILVRPSGTEPLIRITVEGEREDWVREQMEKTVRILTAKEG